jgi:hypothetical protein
MEPALDGAWYDLNVHSHALREQTGQHPVSGYWPPYCHCRESEIVKLVLADEDTDEDDEAANWGGLRRAGRS